MASSSKKLVVIGGGMAGHDIAYAMQDAMQVTLVDPKTYVEVPMAVPRLLVEPDALPARIPYADFLRRADIVLGRAVTMTDYSVEVEGDTGAPRTIGFDYAVIASGSRYSDPLIKAAAATEGERSAEIAAANERYRAARRVVIVGGGAVGVETAGEFVETFPHLKVTLISSAPKLLDGGPSKLGGWAESFLRDRGVELLLGERVASPALAEQPVDGVVTTVSGKTIHADAIVWAAGVKPTTDFVAGSWPEAVDADGQIKVDEYLRLAGHATIFAVGDTTNLPERRMAVIAGAHAEAVKKNLRILAAAADPSTASLVRYKLNPPGRGKGKLMLVTLGRRKGLSSLPFGQFRADFLARIKSEDMLVGRVRKGVGLAAA